MFRHRNSIETWSANAIALTLGGADFYFFSPASTQAYGNNMALIDLTPVIYGIYSGDENQDGVVNLTDMANVYNALRVFTAGYLPSDMNGDNIYQFNKPNKLVLVLCNEAHGPSERLIELADNKITIPKKGKAESLNVASASAVILNELTK